MSGDILKNLSPPATPSLEEVRKFMDDAMKGDPAAVTAFLGKYPFAIDQRADTGCTTLIHAACRGQKAIVELLLDRGAQINAQTVLSRTTALMEAACRGHTETVKLLLEKGADMTAVNEEGETALMVAKRYKREQTAAVLIEQWLEREEMKQRELAEDRAREQAARHLEKLKNRRPPQQPLKKNRP